ncbi:MAG TPA: glycosyltransferase family 2 protein [Patescibacteria group bacterium]|nr:glycosyltransferase family 2 protein [Patescibacteria group bacterium]
MKQIVAFIIIAYRPKVEDLKRLINALKDHPTIIVDNGGTLTFDDVSRATFLSQTTNIGFGAAANIGIHHASGLGADWFVILNQDMMLPRVAVRSLVKLLKKTPPGIAGPISGALDHKRWTTILPADRVDYLTGSCLAIHEKMVGKVGYFYEPYFLYYEDADYCVRAKRAGFGLTKLTLEGISHEESVSLGRGTLRHHYYLARNHLLFVKRLAPHSVKFYEYLRLAFTIGEHIARRERGAILGIRDFFLRRFGPYGGRGT